MTSLTDDVLGNFIEPYLEPAQPVEPSPRERLLQKIQGGRLDKREEVVDPIQQKNEVLQKQLEEVQKERDEAKSMLDAMRRVMQSAM